LLSAVLLYVLIVAAVLILSVALRFWGDEEPDNAITHEQQDEPRGDDEPDLLAAAA
jgi:hypothetical protein